MDEVGDSPSRSTQEDFIAKLNELKEVYTNNCKLQKMQDDDYEAIKKELAATKEKLVAAEKERDEMKDLLKQEESSKVTVKNLLLETRNELKNAKGIIVKTSNELQDANMIISQTKNELMHAREIVIKTRQELWHAREIITENNAQIADMEGYISNLEDELSDDGSEDGSVASYEHIEEVVNDPRGMRLRRCSSQLSLPPIPEENPDEIPGYYDVW